MVDILPSDPDYGRALDPKREAKIRKYLKYLGIVSTGALVDINLILKGMTRSIGLYSTAQIMAFGEVNMFKLPENAEHIANYTSKLEKMVQAGVKYGPGTNSATVEALSPAFVQNSLDFIYKLGDTVASDGYQIVQDAIKQGIDDQLIKQQLIDRVGQAEWEAQRVVRTEGMRVANASSFAQAKRAGQSHWIVDSRAEACELCQETYDGQVYEITDTADLPPLHPNCACIPVFYDDEAEASEGADSLGTEKEQIRENIINDGGIINKDGTSQNTNN